MDPDAIARTVFSFVDRLKFQAGAVPVEEGSNQVEEFLL